MGTPTPGQLIRASRLKQGLTQLKVAKQLGLKTAQSISNLERNAQPVPLTLLVSLCSYLKIDRLEMIQAIVGIYAESLSRLFDFSKRKNAD